MNVSLAILGAHVVRTLPAPSTFFGLVAVRDSLLGRIQKPAPFLSVCAAPRGFARRTTHLRSPAHQRSIPSRATGNRALWREFRPQVAFSEGGIRPAARSRDDAVTRFGEPGLLRLLADRDHVELRSLEPAEDEEATALVPQFQPGQVKLFYVLRNLSSDSPADGRSLKEKQRMALESVRNRQRLNGSPSSLKELSAIAARLLPELTDWRLISASWFDPTRTDTFLNEIARRSSDYRNCYMVPLLTRTVRDGKRVFVVVGGTHAVVQEGALRSALSAR
jgi:hypothetical protein